MYQMTLTLPSEYDGSMCAVAAIRAVAAITVASVATYYCR